jgi:hypothetical protein
MLVLPACGRLKEEYCEFEANLGYIVRPCLQKETNKQNIHVAKIKNVINLKVEVEKSTNVAEDFNMPLTN